MQVDRALGWADDGREAGAGGAVAGGGGVCLVVVRWVGWEGLAFTSVPSQLACLGLALLWGVLLRMRPWSIRLQGGRR